MITSDTLDVLTRGRLVPVVVIEHAQHAARLAETLRDNGIATAEVTLRTPDALAAINAMSAVPGFTVGAGTVLNADQVDAAIAAGAKYLVSPGLDPDSVLRAHQQGVLFVPGVATASEIQRAHSLDLAYVKLFPAAPLGGREAIDAFSGPFPTMKFLPSGGVTSENSADYLSSPAVFAVSGSWMVPRDAISAGDFDTIGRLARAAAASIGSLRP